MEKTELFYEAIRGAMTVTLATAAGDSVTMRVVSPVLYEGAVLLFTAPDSQKYRQLKANPHCCIAVRTFFAEAKATFFGATMLESNQKLREAYAAKFPDAFDEGVAFGGRNAEFILLTPTRLTGWAYENDIETVDGVPTVPFAIDLA